MKKTRDTLPEKEPSPDASEEVVLYMLHCGLDGSLLQEVCRQHGFRLTIHQFPREELFAYHMHEKRKTPDLILIRGHFISLVHEVDKTRNIPYVVVSSKLKYGDGQPVFLHADRGYGPENRLALYHTLAETIREMIEKRRSASTTNRPDDAEEAESG